MGLTTFGQGLLRFQNGGAGVETSANTRLPKYFKNREEFCHVTHNDDTFWQSETLFK